MSKKINKKKKKKTTAIKVVEKKEIWAGAQSLMTKPTNEKQNIERNLIILTAKALNISPFGVNILGNLPYTNKLGLAEKKDQYNKGAKVEYRWIQYAKDDKEKAICEARLTDKEKPLCDWITGECSPATMKMSTLAGYQNHMAQTRAHNRAIYETYRTRIHEEMMANIQRMLKAKEVSEEEASQIGNAAASSSEEIVLDKNIKSKSLPLPMGKSNTVPTNFLDQLRKQVYKAGAKTEKEALEIINKKTGLKLTDLKITEKHASLVLEKFLTSKK